MSDQPVADPQISAVTMMQYDNNKKSLGVSYLLWFFLGALGGHRFYLGRTGSAIVMLVLFALGVVLSIVGVGFLLLGALGIWALVDAFLIPGMARTHNEQLIRQLSA